MANSSLTQVEADALIALTKRRVDTREWDYPNPGGSVTIPLVSSERREPFLLDIRRSRIDLAKGTYQNRGRRVVVLVRLDFGGRPHRNPDDSRIGRRISISIEKGLATNGPLPCQAICSEI